MSSEIFYDKAFIKVPGGYIPIVNHGSSNCFTISWTGREIPEKHWSVLNYPNYGKMIFTADEIKEVAEIYEAANLNNRGGAKKSRYRSFDEGEFGRWILTGMKTAHTIEEYRQYGNTVVLIDYSGEVWQKIPLISTDELLKKLQKYHGRNDFDIGFENDRHVAHPPIRGKRSFDFSKAPEFYVLRAEQGYFVKRSSRRIWFARVKDLPTQPIRKFKTEEAARKYLAANREFFSKCALEIERIQNEGESA